MPEPITLRVIFYQSSQNLWIAQCLEHDIAAQAPNLEELERRMIMTLEAELQSSDERGESPFAGISAAPEEFLEKWQHRYPTFHSAVDAHNGVKIDLAMCA